MPIFTIQNTILKPISEKKFDLEHDIQKLTETNLEAIFGLTFVSGSLNQEFSVRAQEQDFYIDTLAFDEAQKSIVIIEYKKDKSFSVIDQGFAYLSAMLNHKADFILEINERLHKNLTKKDIDWEQSRVIFISPEFTNYQRNAINFKDLPIFLYEVRLYNNDVVEYDPIKPYKTTASIGSLSKDKTIQNVSREVKVYTVEDLFPESWNSSKELYELLKSEILAFGKITEKVTKLYMAFKLFKNGQWYNFVEIVPQANGLKIHLDVNMKDMDDTKRITQDISGVGHWATGSVKFGLSKKEDIPYALGLIKQAYDKVAT